MEDEDRYTRITLRIPKDLHQILVAAADRTSKSLNAEIIGRLQASVPDDTEAQALAVLPPRSSIREDLVSSIETLNALRNEKAIYELRVDLAAATGRSMPDRQDISARLDVLRLEISRYEKKIEQFKMEAMQAYGNAETQPSQSVVGKPTRKPKP